MSWGDAYENGHGGIPERTVGKHIGVPEACRRHPGLFWRTGHTRLDLADTVWSPEGPLKGVHSAVLSLCETCKTIPYVVSGILKS